MLMIHDKCFKKCEQKCCMLCKCSKCCNKKETEPDEPGHLVRTLSVKDGVRDAKEFRAMERFFGNTSCFSFYLLSAWYLGFKSKDRMKLTPITNPAAGCIIWRLFPLTLELPSQMAYYPLRLHMVYREWTEVM